MADKTDDQTGDGKEAAAQKKGTSPGILGGIAFVLAGGAFGIFFLMSSLKAGPQEKTSFVNQKYAEVDLDSVQREMAPDSAVRYSQNFLCQPVLVLNPQIENIEEVKTLIEQRKKVLRGDILHLLYRMPEIYFKKPNLLGRVSNLFLDHVNSFLGPLDDGKSIVSKVIFSQFEVPSN